MTQMAPVARDGITLHRMASDCISGMGWHWMALDGIGWHGMALDGIVLHRMAWDGVDGIVMHWMA